MKDKIDTSTYKEINRAKKQKEKNKNVGKFAKGKYGHSRNYRIYRLVLALILLILILADVVISIIFFHTRKTVFIVFACLLAIPFARNIVDVIMTFKAKPLSNEEYEKTKELSDRTSRDFLYDISITEEDGMYYIPCMVIYNNNILCYTPEVKDTKTREKIKTSLGSVNVDDTNYRIFITEKYQTFEKEVTKLRDADDQTLEMDSKVELKILSMGI